MKYIGWAGQKSTNTMLIYELDEVFMF